MTDYIEEQANELEALESIYPEELDVIKAAPCAVFTITLTSQSDGDSVEKEEDQACCTIQFSYTETYPDEVPVVEITDSENLDDDQIQTLIDIMNTEAESNIGMVMIFTLVSAVQEQLSCLVEETQRRKVMEAERKKREEEELEQKKFEGTKVTLENFLAWKTMFDAEMWELNKHMQEETDAMKGKPTGKELFLRDSSMMDSDVQFLKSEGDDVEVDESLFQDLDDLDLGADLDELDGD